jgi:cytidylate kinase
MFTVALIGPDGAGKTTISRRLEHELPLPVKYVYMGINTVASNHMLPTTRLACAMKRSARTVIKVARAIRRRSGDAQKGLPVASEPRSNRRSALVIGLPRSAIGRS